MKKSDYDVFLAIQRRQAVSVEGEWVHFDIDMLGLPEHIRDILSQWHGECLFVNRVCRTTMT